jgi:hypothetical protein
MKQPGPAMVTQILAIAAALFLLSRHRQAQRVLYLE